MADTPERKPVIEPGYGPPKGSAFDSPWAQPLPPTEVRPAIENRVGGTNPPTQNDPGFQKPIDPVDAGTRPRVQLVYRDVPNVTVQNSWTIQQARGALYAHMNGIFEQSGQLADSMLGDDRVQATLGSRVGGLFGREVRYKAPPGLSDSAAYKECAEAWAAHFPTMIEGHSLKESHAYGIFMGFAHGQIVWDTTGKVWKPYPMPWHPRYEFYEWTTRKYVAISQDGNLAIIPGDGKWYGHLPFGSYRGWVRGAVRAICEPWLGRHFGFRDWQGFDEVHGNPTRVGYVPAAADPGERAQFQSQIAALGANTAMLIPRGVDKDMGYDYKLVEATSESWQSFPGLMDRCDLSIILAIKFQNLTTEITSGGSYAAAKEQGKVDVSQVAEDNASWRHTIRRDFARPFAYINFGDADLAPITDWDVPQPPREDYSANAASFQQLASAVSAFAQAGVTFDDPEEFRDFAREQFGVRMPKKFSIGKPPSAVTAQASLKTAGAAHKTADAAGVSADAAKTKAEKPEPAPKPTLNGAPK